MTLIEVINNIINIAKQQPNINYTGEGDIYQLNSLPNIDYSVFYVTQQNHSQDENTVSYTLTLYYIDRLLPDASNRLQIQSQGILVLNNIINIFNNLNGEAQIEYDINYTTFTHRFTEECAGVFANITITTDNEIGICGY